MRPVLHVISGLRIGGAESALVALAGTLQARGIPQEVACLTPGGPNAARLRDLGVPVHDLDPRGVLGLARTLAALTRLIRRLRPFVVQGWIYHGDLFAAAAHRLAGRPADVRLAWGLRNSDLDTARYGRLFRLCALLSPWPDVVISNSEVGLRFHHGVGYRPRRAVIVPNGVDTARFRPDEALRAEIRAELGLREDDCLIVHPARLDPMKDHATLIAAAGRTPALRYLLLGAGTETLDTPANVLALGPRTCPERYLAAADIVVSTSSFGEGFSNAVAEGMAAGLVPVATEVGDARTLLGPCGRITAPRDPVAVAEALTAFAVLPQAERRDLGRMARRRIEEHFSLACAADRFLAAWAGETGPNTR